MEYAKSPINKLIRSPKKASYDAEVIFAILDANEICTVAFTVDGRAHVQPINFGRDGDRIYLHGSAKNRMTHLLVESGEACVSVFSLDAMKLTRSAFHHSVNFQSVVLFGSVRNLTTDEDKLHGLKTIINHFVPDRWDHCRAPNAKELKATRVLEIKIESASAKIADAPPSDEEADYASDYWAGTIPVTSVLGRPQADERLKPGLGIPEHVQAFLDKKAGKN